MELFIAVAVVLPTVLFLAARLTASQVLSARTRGRAKRPSWSYTGPATRAQMAKVEEARERYRQMEPIGDYGSSMSYTPDAWGWPPRPSLTPVSLPNMPTDSGFRLDGAPGRVGPSIIDRPACDDAVLRGWASGDVLRQEVSRAKAEADNDAVDARVARVLGGICSCPPWAVGASRLCPEHGDPPDYLNPNVGDPRDTSMGSLP